MARCLAGGGWDRAHAAECSEACFGMQALGVVAGGQEQLRGGRVADGVPCHEGGSQLIDDGGDHGIEVGDLVVQFEISASERLERDPIGRCHIAVVSHVRPPGRQRPDELHAGQLAQRVAQLVGRADDRVVDHLQRDAPGGDRRLSAGFEDTQGLDHAVAGLGRDGALAGECRMGGVLGIKIVVLAALATIPSVRCRDLQDLDAGVLQVAKQPRAVGACCLDADAPKLAERAHPGEHLLVAVPGCCEALASENPVMLVDDGGDVEILVGIDAADDEAAVMSSLDFHGGSPEAGMYWRSRQHRMPGQDSNATERQALLGSHASARQNLAARCSRAADRSGERHGWRSIGVRVRPPRHLAAPAILNGPSL